MEKFGCSQLVKWVEDVWFLIGYGCYVDDIVFEGVLVVYFLWLFVVYGVIKELDLDEVCVVDGVYLVVILVDLEVVGVCVVLLSDFVINIDGIKGVCFECLMLVCDCVCYVGEVVVMIVVDSLI